MAASILRGIIEIIASPHDNRVYVGKDYTKRDVINAIKTALALMGEKT